MKTARALEFVKVHGLVLESARGPVPNLAEWIAGEPIRGSWWGHEKAAEIFHCSRVIRDSDEVLVCRLVDGKVTYVHRSLWPALVKLKSRFAPVALEAIREMHTAEGKHEVRSIPFPGWVPRPVMAAAAKLSEEKAAALWPLKLRTKGQH